MANKKRADFNDYQRPEDEEQSSTIVRRITHFLNWAAEYFPYEFIPFTVIAKSINGYTRMPRADNQEVEVVRRSISRCRPVMHSIYGRALVVQKQLGARASVDSLDVVKTEFTNRVGRLKRAGDSLKETAGIVDAASFPKTAEAKPWVDFFSHQNRDTLRMIRSPDWAKRLALPAPQAPTDTNEPS